MGLPSTADSLFYFYLLRRGLARRVAGPFLSVFFGGILTLEVTLPAGLGIYSHMLEGSPSSGNSLLT